MGSEQGRGPGRPEIGGRVTMRLGDDLLSAVDRAAVDLEIARPAVIRRAVAAYLNPATMAAEKALAAAYSRLDRYLARDDDDTDTDWLDPHSTLLDIEGLLHAALLDHDGEGYTPVSATEDMEDED